MTTPQQIEHAAHKARQTLDHYHHLATQITVLRELLENTDPTTDQARHFAIYELLTSREAQRRQILEHLTVLLTDEHQTAA